MTHIGKYEKKQHLDNAFTLMNSGDPQSLRYACLELRFLIEAHVYERLLHGIEELPRTIIETWQPNKAIKELVKFDDISDMNAVLTFSDSEGNTIEKIKYNNLPVKEISRIYNSLGSYLHLPTPLKVSNYKIEKANIEKIYESLKPLVEGNLMIRNIEYKSFKCECCSSDVIYTDIYLKNNKEITCQNENCKINYVIVPEENNYHISSAIKLISCESCMNDISISPENFVDGFKFMCHNTDCKKEYICKIGIFPIE